MFGGVVELLPEWLAGHFRSQQRQLLLMERRVQRRFLNEYRTQVRSLEPVLRARGAFVGRSLLESFAGHHAARVAYCDAECDPSTAASLAEQKKSLTEVLQTLDPLISPILTPFVEGIKRPINQALGSVQGDITKMLCVTAGTALCVGVLLGRWTAPGGGKRGL